MNEITRLGYEKSLLEMSTGASIFQALAIIGMLAFVVWNIKLIFEPHKDEKVKVVKKTEVKTEVSIKNI